MSATITPRQLLDRLRWRYATKQFDPKRKISAADWTALEEALVLSPSSGGLQPWMFIVVDDAATRAKLLPASFGQAQVTDASHLVVFAAKSNFGLADVDAHIAHTAEVRGVAVESLAPFRNMLAGSIVESMDATARQAWAGRQVTIALGNLLTCAALVGIDACPMEGFVPAQYDAILGLKEKSLASVVICTLGYRAATDAYAALPKVRYPKQRVILHA
ncbi:MAG: NAD(P)H-dependent oxidoreductase [Chthoniobacteraceae bacterium]